MLKKYFLTNLQGYESAVCGVREVGDGGWVGINPIAHRKAKTSKSFCPSDAKELK